MHDGLERAAPHSVGASGPGIERFVEHAAALGLELHSLMVWKQDRVIAEAWWAPYRAALPHMLHSLTKSFTATGVGLAVADGLIQLDDRVLSFFPDEAPARPGINLATITVRDLLTMRTGHRTGIPGSAWRPLRSSWVRAFFEAPAPEQPGTRFVYSSASSYMLSAIVQKVAGQTLHAYLRPRFLDPLGCAPMSWDLCPNGINPGGNGLSCRTSDLVRFGAVHLQGGKWEGRRLLPASWVDAATASAVPDVPWDGAEQHLPGAPPQGYGFQWWTGPAGAYYAAGLFGQYTVVLPDANAVVAITAAVSQHDRRLIDLVWRDLRPALSPDDQGTADPAGQAAAGPRALPLPPFAPLPARAARVSDAVFDMAPNEDGVRSVALRFAGTLCEFTLEDARGTHIVRTGIDRLIEGDTTINGAELHHQYQPETMRVAAGGVWTDDDTFTMTWVFNETAFRDTVVLVFSDAGLTMDRRTNVNAGPFERPRMLGRRRG